MMSGEGPHHRRPPRSDPPKSRAAALLPVDPSEESLDLDDETVKELKDFINSPRGLWYDFVQSLYDVRYTVPLVMILSFLLAYYILIAPYSAQQSSMTPISELSVVRPVISKQRQFEIHDTLLHAETVLQMPSGESIAARFHTSVAQGGNYRLPRMFYEGVSFGITSQDSHRVKFTSLNPYNLPVLRNDLNSSFPVPTAIYPRSSHYNNVSWHEKGVMAYYSYVDLEKQGKLSSDVLRPWKRVLDDVLEVARKHHQSYVTVWYPSRFGRTPSQNNNELITTQPQTVLQRMTEDASYNFRYCTLVQEIVPTRTGLDAIKDSAAIWLSSVNGAAPVDVPYITSPDW